MRVPAAARYRLVGLVRLWPVLLRSSCRLSATLLLLFLARLLANDVIRRLAACRSAWSRCRAMDPNLPLEEFADFVERESLRFCRQALVRGVFKGKKGMERTG